VPAHLCIIRLIVVGMTDRFAVLVVFVSVLALYAALYRLVHLSSCVLSNIVCFGERLLFLFDFVYRFHLYASTRLLFLSDNLVTLNVSRYAPEGKGGSGRGRGGMWSGGSAKRKGLSEWRVAGSAIWMIEKNAAVSLLALFSLCSCANCLLFTR